MMMQSGGGIPKPPEGIVFLDSVKTTSTDTLYLDYIPRWCDGFEADIEFIGTINTNDEAGIVSRTTWGGSTMWGWNSNRSQNRFVYREGFIAGITLNISNTRCVLKMDRGSWSQQLGSRSLSGTYRFVDLKEEANGSPVYVTGSGTARVRIRQLNITDGKGDYIRKYIPAYLNGVYCLYEMYTGLINYGPSDTYFEE